MRPLDPRLLRYARTTRYFLGICVTLGVISAILIVAQATLLAHAITTVFNGDAGPGASAPGGTGPTGLWREGPGPNFGTTILALAAVFVCRAVVEWAREVAARRSAATVKTELRQRLLAKVGELGPGWLTRQRTGELATLAGHGLDALDAYFARYLPQLALAALVPSILLVKIFSADALAAITITLTLPLIPAFMILIGLRTQRVNRRRFRQLTRLAHHFLDVVAGLPTLKAFRRVDAQQNTIWTVTNEYRRVTLRTLRIAFLSALVLELLATLSVALVAVGIGLRLVDGDLDLATALLVLVLAPEAYLPLRQIGTNFHASAEGLAAAERVFEIIETPKPAIGTRTDLPDLSVTPIKIFGLTVRYPDRATPAVADLDLELRPGEILALTGASGCGKSTVLGVLLGFVQPSGGRVCVGEVDLADVSPMAWRERVAWVPQRPRLFSGTIAENVRLGAPDAPAWRIRAALRSAGAERFVDGLPEGFDTVLTDGGAGLAAGERQRIALARAFLRDAPLVLLDEPTANLDGDTERGILTAVRRLAAGRTVVIAAHRSALVGLADREIRLDHVQRARGVTPG